MTKRHLRNLLIILIGCDVIKAFFRLQDYISANDAWASVGYAVCIVILILCLVQLYLTDTTETSTTTTSQTTTITYEESQP